MMRMQQALKHSRMVWAGALFSLPVIIFSAIFGVIFGAPALAEEAKIQRMSYDVYASGFHVVGADLVMDFSDEGRYDTSLKAYTQGFLGRIVPWSGEFASKGWVVDEEQNEEQKSEQDLGQGMDYRPETHITTTTWRGEDEVKTYSYGRDRSFKSLTINEHDKKPEVKMPDDALTQGTTDVLSAALVVMERVAAGGLCEGVSDVFDGKRRFEMAFKDKGEKQLSSTRYNIYEGAARECTVEVKPKGGKWYEKPRGWMSIQEQGRAKGTMPTLWMAKIHGNSPAVPIKIRVNTNYGTLFMHLVEYDDGERQWIADKKKSEGG